MQFTKLASIVVLAASGSALAQVVSTTTTYSNAYDDADASTNIVACSNLEPQHPTLGSFPTFPNIGGSFAIAGFESPNCASCWEITYEPTGVTITMTAIDHAAEGFNLSEEALDTLTNGMGEQIGLANVTATRVPEANCGL